MEVLWIIVFAISTPVAGVVGFAIQLKSVRKLRLENEKLSLEIAELRQNKKKSEQQIIVPTNDEVVKYTSDSDRKSTGNLDRKLSTTDWSEVGLLAVVVFVLLYFLYDLYRLGSWLLSKI